MVITVSRSVACLVFTMFRALPDTHLSLGFANHLFDIAKLTQRIDDIEDKYRILYDQYSTSDEALVVVSAVMKALVLRAKLTHLRQRLDEHNKHAIEYIRKERSVVYNIRRRIVAMKGNVEDLVAMNMLSPGHEHHIKMMTDIKLATDVYKVRKSHMDTQIKAYAKLGGHRASWIITDM